jgi:hypothetical protein
MVAATLQILTASKRFLLCLVKASGICLVLRIPSITLVLYEKLPLILLSYYAKKLPMGYSQ